MDKFKQILIYLLVIIAFSACSNQVNNSDSSVKDSVSSSNNNVYTIDTNYYNIDSFLAINKNHDLDFSLEAISRYDYRNKSVDIIFDTLQDYVNIDPILEVSFFVLNDSFRINKKRISFNDLDSLNLYDSFFSCDKEDSSRIFREEIIDGKSYYSSGKHAFIYISLKSGSSNTQKLYYLKELIKRLVAVFYKRRNEISISKYNKPFEELSFLNKQNIDKIVPVKIVIHINS